MSNEEIVKEIDEATRLMAEARVKTNEALCHARNVVMNSKGNEEAYNKGLEDAWELANKISDIDSTSERARIFNYVVGGITVVDILRDFAPQEALAKLEAYEKEQNEIKVGDVVEATDFCDDVFKGAVLDFKDGTETEVFVFDENGCVDVWKIADCKKTGKHMDINNILELIRGD